MLLLRRERSQEECTAWRLQKRKIVKGGSKLIRWLFVIDIMLFGFYVITPRIPFNWNAHLARQVALRRSRAQHYSGEVFEQQEYSEVVEVEEYDDAYDDPYQMRYSEADVDQGGAGHLEAPDSDGPVRGCSAEGCGGSVTESTKEGTCPGTEMRTNCGPCKSPGCGDGSQKAEATEPGQIFSAAQPQKEPEHPPRSKRLTGTCKERNVLRRRIPRDARAGYFIEHIYKPTDTDSFLKQTLCSTSSCHWLQSLLASGGLTRRGAMRTNSPCTNFYRHVCEAKVRSPYKLGADKLMDSMRRIISRHKTQQGGLPVYSDSLFKRCMEGVDLMIKDHIRYDWDEKKLDGCTYNMPKTPLTLSDRFFKSGRRRTMPEFFDYIKSLTNNLSLDDSTLPAKGFFTREWIPAACQWVARAARCHYAIDLAMETGEHLQRYQLYWKVIYFSPLLGPMANRIFEAVFEEPPKARVQACFNLMEDHYIRNTTKTARHALKIAIRRPHDILSKVSWLLRWALRDRVPRWLSLRNRTKAAVEATDLPRADAAAGDATNLEAQRFNESVAADVRRHLYVVDAEFMNSMRHRDVPLMSLFTADTQYVKKRKAVVVSPGLVSVIMNVTHSTDPIATVLIGAPIMRAMVPRRQGAYKWRSANQNNLNRAVKCVERKMASSKAIAERVQTESAILQPLFDAYRRSLADEIGLGTRLTVQYSNNELFYVLWAHGHCDDPLADVVVNGVVNNSAHFAKTFGCSRGDRLWSEDKCLFWT